MPYYEKCVHIYLKNLPSAEINKNMNVFDSSAFGRELYECD